MLRLIGGLVLLGLVITVAMWVFYMAIAVVSLVVSGVIVAVKKLIS